MRADRKHEFYHSHDNVVDITKLTRPSVSNILQRDRLINQLKDARKNPIIWVSGPAGSGKTSLVSSCVDVLDISCLWYRVDSGDEDLATFFYYLSIAAGSFAPDHSQELPLLTPEYLLNIPQFSRNFFNKLYTFLQPPAVIVLDNYQTIVPDSALHGTLLEGLSRLPDGINIIVISRTPPCPAFSRLLANQKIGIIGWQDLRFTHDEFLEVTEKRSSETLPPEQSDKLYQLLDGWIAGLQLLLSTGTSISTFKKKDTSSHDTIFNYFASEAFDCLEPDLREFLLATSIPPFITPDLAAKLTGASNTDKILTYLFSNSLFTNRLSEQFATYEYHDLFREFLLTRAQESIPPEKLRILQRKAASLLIDLQRFEEAEKLLNQAGDTEGIVRLVMEQGESLIKQGRHEIILNWTQALPDEVKANHPWMLYWQGMAHLHRAPLKARPFFIKSYNGFKPVGESSISPDNIMGIMVSWLGITDSFLLEICNFREVDHWISELDKLSLLQPNYPSMLIEFRITVNYFGLLLFRCPHHKDMPHLAERLQRLSKEVSEPEFGFTAESLLVHYYNWMGKFPEARIIMDNLDALLQHHDVPIYARLSSYVLKGNYYWLVGLFDESHENSAEALALAKESGIEIWNNYFLSLSAFASLSVNEVKAASAHLDIIASNVLGRGTMDEGGYYLLCSWKAILQNDFVSARTFSEAALNNAIDNGFAFPIALCRTNLSQVLFEIGDTEQADSLSAKAYEYAKRVGSTHLQYKTLLARSYFAFKTDKLPEAGANLQQALELGKKMGYVNTDWWRNGMMSFLCRKALGEHIEEQYVQELVRKRKLVPKAPPLELENWPWPVKIYTMGRFEVVLNDSPFKSTGKAKKKQLELLKTVIAHGGREVDAMKVADYLWPDADGDMQHSSLTTTLHRLRKILGTNESIIMTEGKLQINDKHCWVDTWAFQRQLSLADLMWSTPGNKRRAAEITEKALTYYQGPFLAMDSSEYWSMFMREKLRSKFLQALCELGSFLEENGRDNEAAELYLKGIDVEPLAETLYQQLIILYVRTGNEAEAIAVYNRCESIFSEILGMELSSTTQQLHRTITQQ